MHFRKVITAALISAAYFIPVHADVIFNNFGAGNAVENSALLDVKAGSLPTVEFWSYTDYEVSEIDVSLVNVGGTNGAILSLLRSTKSGAPGTALGSWKVSGQPSFGYDGPLLTNVTQIRGVRLASGQRYFLRIEPADETTADLWTVNYFQIPATIYNGSTLAAYSATAPAFDIIGCAVLPGVSALPNCGQ